MARTTDRDGAKAAIEAFLRAVGAPLDDDPELRSTGDRVAAAFIDELLAGYDQDPARILADTTATRAPGLVVVRGLPVSTMCPHHLLPAQGVAHVGYLPDGKIVGLGALGRLTECYARRLILQEDLGQRVADALVEHLGARGAACMLDLAPTCLTGRGGRHHGARAVTTAFAGPMAADPELSRQFLASIGT
ncbi:MAG: GTP cyclohydrolase I [Myxococcota bacterium]